MVRSVGWFAIRVTPGFQRMARHVEDSAENLKGESIVERNLRIKGIDVYMPSFWREIRRHRSRKLIARRFPLLVGYAFIRHEEARGFQVVRDVDGVNGVLRVGKDGQPHMFSDDDLSEIAALAFQKEQDFRWTRHQAIETAKVKRRDKLNAQLGRIVPKGRSRVSSLREHAEKYIGMMAEAKKARVLSIIQQLDALEDDASVDMHREAV